VKVIHDESQNVNEEDDWIIRLGDLNLNGDLKNKTRLEALISPRKNTNHLPKLTYQNLRKGLRKLPIVTAISPRRQTMSKFIIFIISNSFQV